MLTCGRMLAVTILISGVSLSKAENFSLKGEHDPTAPNFFTLDFGDGSPRQAQISDTNFNLRLDPVAGTARFVSYEQFIDPIDIPIGENPPGNPIYLSTGPITVRILTGSTPGSFDAKSGQFDTLENYEISFTEDLSFIGFFSPVVLKSPSSGNVVYTSAATGTIDQTWEGDTFVGLIPLHYECRVNTTFTVRYPGDMNCDLVVTTTDIDGFVLALTSPGEYGQLYPSCDADSADINGDGVISPSDIAAFVSVLNR